MLYKPGMFRFVILFLVFAAAPVEAGARLLVFAAASQKDVLEEIGRLYETQCGCEIAFSFAATSTLARQVDAGAKADVLISASEDWADWLAVRGNAAVQERRVIASNQLVIASSLASRDSFNVLKRGRFAMADPVSVPAGIYAQQALTSMGLWESVSANAVYSDNVRVALALVSRGDLMSGIVYRSDLHLTPGLHVHYSFDPAQHDPIHYVAVVTSEREEGKAFLEFLMSESVQQLFLDFGFLPMPETEE